MENQEKGFPFCLTKYFFLFFFILLTQKSFMSFAALVFSP